MRGEEVRVRGLAPHGAELPPHARRRATSATAVRWAEGITSACAEKRARNHVRLYPCGNYLRMRGEECRVNINSLEEQELPPHARRRATAAHCVTGEQGITSACAEKSSSSDLINCSTGNYLRMRGEEIWRVG